MTSPSQQVSETSFFIGDGEFSSPSSRSTSFCYDRPNSSFEDPFSPVFQNEHFSPSINTAQRPQLNSSSSSSSILSSQQYSPAVVRTAPVYISVFSTTSPMPIVKSTVSSSAPPTNDDELIFSRRSPSPTQTSTLKKNESLTNRTRPTTLQTDVNIQQQSPSSIYKFHRHLATSSEEQEKQ